MSTLREKTEDKIRDFILSKINLDASVGFSSTTVTISRSSDVSDSPSEYELILTEDELVSLIDKP